MADVATPTVDRHISGIGGSIRFRLTVLYSVLLFGLGAIVVGGIYAGLSRSLENQDVSHTERAQVLFRDTNGEPMLGQFEFQVADPLAVFEREINTKALDQLRNYAFGALGVLFVGSLGVGWFVAGIVLRPVGRITGVARDIQATDLSRRINLEGRDDELKQLADTFDDMLSRIDDAFASQRDFIHEASHELRNPLAVIRTNIDVVLDDPESDVEDYRAASEVVGRSASRMSTLVDDLLDYARHGTRPTREEDLDLGDVACDLAGEFATLAEAHNLTLEASVGDGQLPVCGDGPAIRRAIANLLANAVRLAPAGSTVRVGAGEDEYGVWVSVTDEGPGIDPADQLHVFNRFWRGDRSKAREEGRSGLGLTIVQQIAQAHGGRVDLYSTVGSGSSFVIRLPRSHNQPAV